MRRWATTVARKLMTRAGAPFEAATVSKIFVFAADGTAVLLISSELPEVLLLSHRILVMCEGRITGEVRGDAATQENLMELATRREALAA